MEVSKEFKKPVWIRLCDTMGYGVPYPWAALPRSVPKLVQVLIRECGVPKDWLPRRAAPRCALGGAGGPGGTPPLEGAVMEYIGFKGTTNGMDPTVITEIAEYL